MKKLSFLLAGTLILATSGARAEDAQKDLVLYAKPLETGTVAVGNKIDYTKTFQLEFHNRTDKPINYDGHCFTLIGKDQKDYPLEFVELGVAGGDVKAHIADAGRITFKSPNKDIYETVGVYYSSICTPSKDGSQD